MNDDTSYLERIVAEAIRIYSDVLSADIAKDVSLYSSAFRTIVTRYVDKSFDVEDCEIIVCYLRLVSHLFDTMNDCE